MKKLLILFAVVLGTGCWKPKKPFIIVSKGPVENGLCWYSYRDAAGHANDFYDIDTLYYIGDTIE